PLSHLLSFPTRRSSDLRKHAIYTISGYIAAFLMFLGYVLFIAIDLNADNNMPAFFVLLSSILFWAFGIWNNLSGFDDVIDSKDRSEEHTSELQSRFDIA